MIHKKVEFRGEIYWLHNTNISPLDHYDDKGNLLANEFEDVSFAVLHGNSILRYGNVIGTIDELKEVTSD